MTRRLLAIGHAADHTGPAVYLRDLLRWARGTGVDVDVQVALLSGGPLLEELRDLAPVTVFDPLPEADDEEREAILRGRVDEAEWWSRRRRDALGAMMAPFADRRVVYATCAPAVELARSLPPSDRVLLSHVHELRIGLTHRLAPDDHAALVASTRLFSVAGAVTDLLVSSHGVDPARVEVHREMIDAKAVAETTGALDRAAARRERGLVPDHHVVAACGTVEFRKGTDLFLQVAWHLRRAGLRRPLSCVWVGGDPDGIARAEARAVELGVDDVVRFVGPQHDAPTWFALADVFLMPSREDTYPLVCIEAAAAATPIVAFDTGGIVDLIDEGCGAVVAYPHVASMAAEVARLLGEPGERASLGRRGRDVVLARHDISVVAPRVWAAIEPWLGDER